jgi:hypothetical protein
MVFRYGYDGWYHLYSFTEHYMEIFFDKPPTMSEFINWFFYRTSNLDPANYRLSIIEINA